MMEGNVYPKFGKILIRNVATRLVTRKLLKMTENREQENLLYDAAQAMQTLYMVKELHTI